MTIPTHLIMVLNRETFELKLVSAHLAGEAQAAFENLSSLFANTANDVHKVTVPSDCGFVIGEIVSSRGKVASVPNVSPRMSASDEKSAVAPFPTSVGNGGIYTNAKGEYVQRLPDGSEIISSSDFGDE